VNLLSQQARAIFAEAMRQVDVRRVTQHHLQCDGETITLGEVAIPLRELDQLLILALGKAAVPMYQAAHEALRRPLQLECHAVVIAPQAPAEEILDADFLRGPHPTPDRDSLRAADAVLSLLRRTTPRTAVLFLVSGGASAMMEKPLDPRISIADVAAFHHSLVRSGLSIAQMNALRKHLSAVKGGRLAQAAAAARLQCTLLVSDVPSANSDAIASGPSLPDSTTLAECHTLLAKLQHTNALPASIASFFDSPLCVETPKSADPAFDRAHWRVILSSDDLAQAAAVAADALGFHVEIDNTCDEWEYREAARYLLDRIASLQRQHSRGCLISTGEVAVTIPPHAGEGGRNQQFALWSAAELAHRGEHGTILSAGSDGIDGRSSAAGAVCDTNSIARASQLGLSVEAALAYFDSSPLLRALGDDIVTGPTANNLRDLRLLLSDSSGRKSEAHSHGALSQKQP
jgi:glycerate 2-kinase